MVRSHHLCGRLVALMALLALSFLPAAVAAAAISQGYDVSQPLTAGTLVDRQTNNNVTIADMAHGKKLLGVVVSSSNVSVAIGSSSSQTQVVTSGNTDALITDLNGPIRNGDPITTSPIDGVGMKATSYSVIIGFAEGNIKSGSGTPVTVKSDSGVPHQATIQSIPVNVDVENYTPGLQGSAQSLQRFANSLAGKPVSLVRLTMSGLVLVFAALAVFIVLYAGIHNGFVAIGRNPLAKRVINTALLKTIVGAIVIVACSLAFAYLILIA